MTNIYLFTIISCRILAYIYTYPVTDRYYNIYCIDDTYSTCYVSITPSVFQQTQTCCEIWRNGREGLTFLRSYLLWLVLASKFSMPQLSLLTLAPRIEFAVGGDGCTVGTATGYLTNMLPLQTLNHFGSTVTPASVCMCVSVSVCVLC